MPKITMGMNFINKMIAENNDNDLSEKRFETTKIKIHIVDSYCFIISKIYVYERFILIQFTIFDKMLYFVFPLFLVEIILIDDY